MHLLSNRSVVLLGPCLIGVPVIRVKAGHCGWHSGDFTIGMESDLMHAGRHIFTHTSVWKGPKFIKIQKHFVSEEMARWLYNRCGEEGRRDGRHFLTDSIPF